MEKLLKIVKMIVGIIASIIGILVFIGVVFMYTSSEFGAAPLGEDAERIQASQNFKDGKFQNLTETNVDGNINWGRSLKEWFTKGDKVPSWSLPVNKISAQDISATKDSITKVTWFGHSAILLELDGVKIFIDPMLGDVPAPHPLLGSKRFNDTLPLAMDKIPRLDAVLISHDHYDHLDYKSIVQLKNRVGHFYVPLGVGSHLQSWGVPSEKITELDWWDTTEIDGITLIATPARHFSGRGIRDRMKTQWCSWVLKGKKDAIYFSGDSGYESHFAEIGQKYGPFDLAIMECGQYDEQWPLIHMMPEETVQASLDVQSKLTLPIHWGSFKLSLHAWEDPIERFTRSAKESNLQITTPIIGEPIIIGQPAPTKTWWVK